MLIPEERTCHRLQLQSPTLTTDEFLSIASLPQSNKSAQWSSFVIDITYTLEEHLEGGLRSLCDNAEKAVRQGYNFLILSDASADANKLAIPALM